MQSYLIVLLFPISSDFHIVPFTKDIPSTPHLVKALGHSPNGEADDLDLLDHMFPSCFGVHDGIIPAEVFNLKLVLNLTLDPEIQVESHGKQWKLNG